MIDFTNAQIRFNFPGTMIAGKWTIAVVWQLDTLGQYHSPVSINSSANAARMAPLITPGNDLRFYQPGGTGDEQKTPSPALIAGHRYLEILSRPDIDASARLRYFLKDLSVGGSTPWRATGDLTVSDPAAHSGGNISLGVNGTGTEPMDGKLASLAIWRGVACQNDAHEDAMYAHARDSDFRDHTFLGLPYFMPHLEVNSVGAIVDYGSAGLTVASSSGTLAFPADATAWNHDLDDPIAPPQNDVAPSILGSLYQGGQLTLNRGSWSGASATYTQQWRRDGVNISGATSTTYVTQLADIGSLITCRVTATNSGGPTSVISNSLGPIKASVPTPRRFNWYGRIGGEWVRMSGIDA